MSEADRVLAALQHGRWQTLSDLGIVLGIPRREVESAVEVLRLGGTPVIGGNEGVKLTAEPRELEAYLAQRRYRTAAIHRGTMRLRSTLRRMKYGDQEAFDWDRVA